MVQIDADVVQMWYRESCKSHWKKTGSLQILVVICQLDGQLDGWEDACGWMDGQLDGWEDAWMEGWVDRWMASWMDGRMPGWMDGFGGGLGVGFVVGLIITTHYPCPRDLAY